MCKQCKTGEKSSLFRQKIQTSLSVPPRIHPMADSQRTGAASLRSFSLSKKSAGRKKPCHVTVLLIFVLFQTRKSGCPCRDNAFCCLRQAPLSVSAYADRGAFLAPAVFRQPISVATTAFFATLKPPESRWLSGGFAFCVSGDEQRIAD